MLRSGSFDEDTAREHEIGGSQYSRSKLDDGSARLGLRATAKLSLEFCLLWVWSALIPENGLLANLI